MSNLFQGIVCTCKTNCLFSSLISQRLTTLYSYIIILNTEKNQDVLGFPQSPAVAVIHNKRNSDSVLIFCGL